MQSSIRRGSGSTNITCTNLMVVENLKCIKQCKSRYYQVCCRYGYIHGYYAGTVNWGRSVAISSGSVIWRVIFHSLFTISRSFWSDIVDRFTESRLQRLLQMDKSKIYSALRTVLQDELHPIMLSLLVTNPLNKKCTDKPKTNALNRRGLLSCRKRRPMHRFRL